MLNEEAQLVGAGLHCGLGVDQCVDFCMHEVDVCGSRHSIVRDLPSHIHRSRIHSHLDDLPIAEPAEFPVASLIPVATEEASDSAAVKIQALARGLLARRTVHRRGCCVEEMRRALSDSDDRTLFGAVAKAELLEIHVPLVAECKEFLRMRVSWDEERESQMMASLAKGALSRMSRTSQRADPKIVATAELVRALDADEERMLQSALHDARAAGLESKWVGRAEAALAAKLATRQDAAAALEAGLRQLLQHRQPGPLDDALAAHAAHNDSELVARCRAVAAASASMEAGLAQGGAATSMEDGVAAARSLGYTADTWQLVGLCQRALLERTKSIEQLEACLKAALEIGVRSRQEDALVSTLAEARALQFDSLLVRTCQTALDHLQAASAELDAELQHACHARTQPELESALASAAAANHRSDLVAACKRMLAELLEQKSALRSQLSGALDSGRQSELERVLKSAAELGVEGPIVEQCHSALAQLRALTDECVAKLDAAREQRSEEELELGLLRADELGLAPEALQQYREALHDAKSCKVLSEAITNMP